MTDKKSILIVEDEKVLGELLLEKLLAEGYAASLAVDGEAGLAAMRAQVPDLVLLDIVMPKKDGYEVLRDMRADQTLKDVPVLVISNSGQPIEIQEITKLGVTDYIVKAEFSPAEVLEKIRARLDKQQSHALKGTTKQASSDVAILIVEDDPFLSSIAAERLQQEGYRVSVATTGEDALDALMKEMPDLVLLDIVMPGISGFDVLKAIKADKKLQDISVVMFSNLGQEHEVEECKKLGADAFLVKAQFTPREVLLKIQEILKKKGRI